ncbi:MAG: hypothetical protein KKF44_11325, partial [Nanoarchaeota archaeon]|nr:hypothetical protein [Nanoarchaeota archaeon]
DQIKIEVTKKKVCKDNCQDCLTFNQDDLDKIKQQLENMEILERYADLSKKVKELKDNYNLEIAD